MRVRLLSYSISYGSVPWITENPCLIASELAGPPPIFKEQQQVTPFKAEIPQRVSEEEEIPDAPILKPLTSLKWPYIPDQPSSYEDPLTRDDPKPLQLHQYQAMGLCHQLFTFHLFYAHTPLVNTASSAAIRAALLSNTCLPSLLRKVDKLRGPEREEVLETLLGVSQNRNTPHGQQIIQFTSEETKAFRQLAEAVERSVRGEKTDVLGLDWVEGH